MKLLIDVGNLRLKWAYSTQLVANNKSYRFEDDVDTALQYQVESSDLGGLEKCVARRFAATVEPEPAQGMTPDMVYVSSVANDEVNLRLARLCEELWQLSPVFIRSGNNACGIVNRYDAPETLGVDRWAALIGARRKVPSQHALLVVDAGTAVTIDYVDSSGVFSGGIIFPGIATMIGSINRSTGKISVDSVPKPGAQICLQNPRTSEAVGNGVLHTVVSSIDSAIDHYMNFDQNGFDTIITGGDTGLIKQLSRHKMQSVPELVLLGILTLSEAENS